MVNDQEYIIQVKNAKKIYRMGKERIVAVDDVSFSIKKESSAACTVHPVPVNLLCST